MAEGRYTVIVSLDTGPFFGVIEGRLNVEIQRSPASQMWADWAVPVVLRATVEGEPVRDVRIGRLYLDHVDRGFATEAYFGPYREGGIPLAHGAYHLTRGEFYLDDDQGVTWGVQASGGDAVAITSNAPTTDAVGPVPSGEAPEEAPVSLRRPTLEVEYPTRRPVGSGDDALSIAPGTVLHPSHQVRGPNGRVYGSFMRGRPGAMALVEPRIRVLDSDGQTVAIRAMGEDRWDSGRVRMDRRWAEGRYTVVLSLDTGPFFGVIEDRQDFVIQ